jgi:hypothetical protein
VCFFFFFFFFENVFKFIKAIDLKKGPIRHSAQKVVVD